MTQHEMRKMAMQAIYIANQDPALSAEETLTDIRTALNLKEVPDYASELIQGVLEKRVELDQALSQKLKQNWQLTRIAQIDRAILEVALYEIKNSQVIAPVAAVNEALNLCDEFSDPKSKAFVNGVLANFIEKN